MQHHYSSSSYSSSSCTAQQCRTAVVALAAVVVIAVVTAVAAVVIQAVAVQCKSKLLQLLIAVIANKLHRRSASGNGDSAIFQSVDTQMTTHHILMVIIKDKSSCIFVETYVNVCCMNSTKLTCDVSAPSTIPLSVLPVVHVLWSSFLYSKSNQAHSSSKRTLKR
jgi:hypothetical protein